MYGIPLEVYYSAIEKVAAIQSEDVLSKVTNNRDELLKKLKIGDIILTKPNKGNDNIISKLIRFGTKNPWTHGGVYQGDGKMKHFYKKVTKEGIDDLGDFGIRTVSLSSMGDIRDLYILRPKVPFSQKLQAPTNMDAWRKIKYSHAKLLRAWAAQGDEKDSLAKVTSGICTGAIAAAYPSLVFKEGIDQKYLRPSDIAGSSKVVPIIAYSRDLKERE